MEEETMMQDSHDEKLLDSWKEIANYLGRDVSTVRRWEKEEALPVHRHQHHLRSSVYAYPHELDAWREQRRPSEEAPRLPGWLGHAPARILAFALMLVLSVLTAGGGMILAPPTSAAEGDGMVARSILDRIPYGRVAPDGSFITDVDWSTGDLAVVELASMKLRRLTNKGSWIQSSEYAEQSVVSPDGKQIAYAWFNGKHYDLRVIGVDGSGMRLLYSHPDTEYVLPGSWSADGRYVAATLAKGDKANQIVLVSVAEGTARVLKTFDWRFPEVGPFSPDRRHIVYSFPPQEDLPANDIFQLAIDGSREVALVTHPANDVHLGWSEDGREFFFRSNRTGSVGVWAVSMHQGAPSGAPHLYKPNLGPVVALGMTRSGSLYYGVRTSLRDAYVAPLDLTTGTGLGTPQAIRDDQVGMTLWPRWSYDGKSLVYLRNASMRVRSDLTIVVRSMQTGEERELKPGLVLGHEFRTRPSLSPDGRSILLATRDRQGRQGIYAVDSQTAEVTRVVGAEPGTTVSLPAWSPDGKVIFYLMTQGQTASIVARDASTGQERKLYVAAPPLRVAQFNVSRDGQQVAFVQDEQTSRSTTVLVKPVAGGEPREVYRIQEPESLVGAAVPGWTPDGRFIIIRKFRAQRPEPEITLWAIPVAGGEPKKLGRSPEGFLLGLDVHPDGQRLAFTAGLQKAELWVMENFLPVQKAAKEGTKGDRPAPP